MSFCILDLFKTTTMKKYLQLIFVFLSFNLFAQIPNGSIAPDFVATDLDGNEYRLYDILAEGKNVIIDFSATWCGPCWSFHQTHALEDFYNEVGPDGDDSAMVFYVESDITTGLADLQGNTASSMGDWITGTSYPILDNSSISASYQIGAYPTIMKICVDRRVEMIGRYDAEGYKDDVDVCPSIEYGSEPFFFADKYVSCGILDVQFTDDSWPRPTSWLWDFGDNNTSDEQSPMHTYEGAGEYSVSLKVGNEFGENEVIKEFLIKVGEGIESETEKVGPTNFDIGSGRYFEGGHQALIFDVEKPMVLESATVFSDKAADRTIVLLDAAGQLISSKVVYIPEGEQLVNIDFFVPEGTGFQIGMRSDAYLFRNDGGVNYPYEVEGLMSIVRSTAGSTPTDPDALRYYYYFYDWNVRDAECRSGSSTVDVQQNFSLYPNPVSNELKVQGQNISSREVFLHDVLGNSIHAPKQQKADGVTIDVTRLNVGLYLITVGDTVQKFYKE